MENILVEFLGKNGSGISFTYEVVKAFIYNGYKVYVILSDRILNKKLWEQLEINENNVEILFINTGDKKTFISTSFDFMLGKKKILNNIVNIKFKFAFRTFPHPWMEIIERSIKIDRVFYILHDPIPHTGTGLIRRIISKRNVRTATDIIVLSKKFIQAVIDIYDIPPKNVNYMKLGILKIYDKDESIHEVDEKKIDDNEVNFLFFGRIDEYKGLHTLSEAYKMIVCKHDNIGLIVAGSGDFQKYKDEYSILKNCIVINRYIKDSEMATLFTRNNTVVVLPYLDATQSGVITVAAEYGCPIIASETGALREQLNDGTLGLYFKPGSSTELANCMEEIIRNTKLLNDEKVKMKILKDSLNWNLIIKEFLNNIE